jgi:hypothetical protein
MPDFSGISPGSRFFGHLRPTFLLSLPSYFLDRREDAIFYVLEGELPFRLAITQ